MIKFESLPADILLRIPEVKRVLAEDNNIVFAYIFGGLAEGKVNPLSDLDIAVYIRDTNDLAEYKINLFDRIANSLGTSELDLIILNTASISITGRISRGKTGDTSQIESISMKIGMCPSITSLHYLRLNWRPRLPRLSSTVE
ncbi:MAG: nucleotidyltransferase domain-containing protein [Thermodesulfovibrionales bacterium]